MISALFNLLCIGSFATFGLTCTLLHNLCCRRCGRRYPAIENVPCSCTKYTPSKKSTSAFTNTSNPSQKNNNRRRSSINEKIKKTPTESNYNSDISVDSRNNSLLQENGYLKNGVKRNNCSCLSKSKETNTPPSASITLSYNSDIFNKFTINSSNSDLSNNISICINSCLNKNPAVSNVEQQKSPSNSTDRNRSIKSTSTYSPKNFNGTNNSKSCIKCNKNSTENKQNSISGTENSNYNSSSQTNSGRPSLSSETSALDQFQKNIQFEDIRENNSNLASPVRPNSNIEQSSSMYEFSDSSNSAVINLMRPIYCKCGRNMNSDDDLNSDSYGMIQCEPNTNTFKSSDSEDMFALETNTETSNDLSEFLANNVLSSIDMNENISHKRSSSQQDENKYFSKNRSVDLKSKNFNPPNTNKIKPGLDSSRFQSVCCKNCDCLSKNVDLEYDESNSQISFDYESTSSNESNQAIASRTRGSTSPTMNSIKNFKSKLRSNEYQANCCTKCNCTQSKTPNKYETTTQTIRNSTDLLNSECQTECCTKCSCVQTEAQTNCGRNSQRPNNEENQAPNSEFNKNKSGTASSPALGCNQCQSDCCAKCECSKTVASKVYERISDAANQILSTKYCSECPKTCCSKCSCIELEKNDTYRNTLSNNEGLKDSTPSVASNIYKKISDATDKILSKKWSDEDVISCCSKCPCVGPKSFANTDNALDSKEQENGYCTQSVASNIYRKISDATDKLLTTKWSSENLMNNALETDSPTRNQNAFCSNECQTDCCTRCTCSQIVPSELYERKSASTKFSNEYMQNGTNSNYLQTIASKKLDPNALCSNECQTDCCTKCNCTQTLRGINAKLQTENKPKPNLCSGECQTECCTKCNCAQTTETGKCKKDCQKDCCIQCNCSKTLSNFDANFLTGKPKSKSCNDGCQTDCCTKCNCSQTTKISKCKKDCQKNCCTQCDCSHALNSFNANVQTKKSKSNLCSNACQTECCTKCCCSQTTETGSQCKKDCQKNCCTKCNCSQTLNSINEKLQTEKPKTNLCSGECQTDCCTKCNCSQTTESSKCKKDCQKNCCTICNCSQTLNSFDSNVVAEKRKSNLCSDECQTDCCTKCNCSQTTEFSKCKKDCQKDCCTKCNCSQTLNSFDANLPTEKRKFNLCSDECQTECCTKCNCSQTAPSKVYETNEILNTSKCKKDCQKDCCTNCDCEQASKNFKTANKTKSKLCSDECQTDCCEKCNCGQTTNSLKFDQPSSGNLNSGQPNSDHSNSDHRNSVHRNSVHPNSDHPNFDQLNSDLPKPDHPNSDHSNSELSVNESKSNTTMTMKRKRVIRKCCNPTCVNNNDAVLVHGDIQLKEMKHKPLKYVFQTEESENKIRIHELSLKIKPRGTQAPLDNIHGKYLLKLRVHS